MGAIGDTALGIAGNAASGAIGAGMGLLLEKHNDARQIRQQQSLTDMQFKSNAAMAQLNQQLQLDTWNKTNYAAQVEQLKKAGLNPALLYGMSGGGGATTGGAAGAGVSGAMAPSGGGEIMGLMMQKAQMDMLKAQTENIKAGTAKTNAEIPNVGLTGKQITASTGNIEADTKLKGLQAEAQQIANKIQGDSAENQIATYQQQLQKTVQEVNALVRNNSIGDDLRETTIQQAKKNLDLTIIETSLKKQLTAESQANVSDIASKIWQRIEQVRQTDMARQIDWANWSNNAAQLGLKERQHVDELINQINEDSGANVGKDILKNIIPLLIFKGFPTDERRNH